MAVVERPRNQSHGLTVLIDTSGRLQEIDRLAQWDTAVSKSTSPWTDVPLELISSFSYENKIS